VRSSGLSIPVVWKESPGGIALDDGVRLKFQVRNAKLYSFRVRE